MAGSGGKKRSRAGARVRARRDFEALQNRRMAAADMFARGKRQVDVVDKLGVSAQTASRWHRTFLAEGKKGLAGAGRAGRLPKLSDEQLTGFHPSPTRHVVVSFGLGAPVGWG
ncbi:helix-turn-helix domain-containing protein [Mycobacterium ostraviense]|uniref:helix-turn-helix domain-containing protein n=1 Tax=Mycobacterium ostraviense TaxID=2738409 RepID=UPI0011568774|nr:helix-turn-helix domain-containing protein [Mycobacterium ostraviense]UGT93490.1 helix-turn-helix domain-containing protein [Mycobacterium ostraviense]